MAKYQISRQAEVGIAVNNLFDRNFYDAIGSYSTKLENIYGAPRQVAVNLRYAF
ncbi:Ferric-pseudobactin BN7/BN8 receptor precursor [compost metagenome]